MFDYLFYRLFVFYKTREPKSGPIFTASLYFSFFQFLLIYLAFMLVAIFTNGEITINNIGLSKREIKAFGLMVLIGLPSWNYVRYKSRAAALELKYRNHPLNKKLKLWMIMLLCWGIIFFPFGLKAVLRAI